MRRMRMTTFAVVVAALSLQSCLPKRRNSNLQASTGALAPAGNGKSGISEGLPLKSFDYNYNTTLLTELGARVGCVEAGKMLVAPEGSAFYQTVSEIISDPYKNGESMYQKMRRRLWDSKVAASNCSLQLNGRQERDPIAGLKKLMAIAAKSQEDGKPYGLTMIVVGGLGSYLVKREVLHDNAEQWRAYAKTLPEGTLRIWHHNCSRYLDDSYCVPEMVKTLEKRDLDEPTPMKHMYVFWGYSMGGLMAFDALEQSPDLRAKTLAVVTAASPFGGTMTASTVLDVYKKMDEYRSSDLVNFEASKFAVRSAIAGISGSDNPYIPMVGDNFADGRTSFTAMLPDTMAAKWKNQYSKADFQRPGDVPIPIFQLAAILDFAEMPGLPAVTYSSGMPGLAPNSGHPRQMAQLMFVPTLARFPFQDACLSLQHAVIPQQYRPQNVKSYLTGVFKLDHGAMSLSQMDESRKLLYPFTETVDAVLASVAIGLAKE